MFSTKISQGRIDHFFLYLWFHIQIICKERNSSVGSFYQTYLYYKSFCKSFEIVENAENSLQMAFVFHFSIFFTNTFLDFNLKSKRLQNSKFYIFGIIAGTNYLMLIFISGYLSDKIYIFDLLKPEYTLIVYHTKLFFDTKIGGPS